MKQLILTTALITSTLTGFTQKQIQQTMFTTSPDSIRIAYEVLGKAEPALIFIHGWSCDRSYWKNQLPYFSKNYKVAAIDLAGHGESGMERKAWTIEAYGGDVAAVINKLGLKKVILIGHSMGGDVIAEAARLLKDRVVGLIMIDTYKKLGAGRSPEEVQAFKTKLQNNFKDEARPFIRSMFIPSSDSVLVNFIVTDMLSAPPNVAIPSVEAAMSYSRRMPASLEELRLPVIAINPDNAPTDTASLYHYGVEVIIMHGVDHFLMMENPAEFNRLLAAAITKLERSK